jgi:para-aminobenzoate synthetase
MTPGAIAHFLDVAARHPRCFWLDGGGAREWSRQRSMIGWLDDDDVSLTYDAARGEVTRHASGGAVVVGADPFVALEAELAAGSSDDQWFGYFGYAARPDLPARPAAGLPDAVWMRAREIRFFTHPDAPGPLGTSSEAAIAATDPDDVPEEYAAAFAQVQEQLRAGNSYEVNLTHRVEVVSDLEPTAAYLRLRALNPAPYAGFLQHDVPGARAWLLSSSPERYALVGADRTIETKPIKGTTPRGRDAGHDDELRTRLATDPKFRAENLMIVDLLRNDLAMVCAPGTVEVPVLMAVESYATVHQLVSTVRGALRDDVTTVGALRALFPAGSMTGAPKLRTMQIIDAVEASPRGPYAGTFGWIAGDGRADLGVVIRSLMTAGDGRYVLGTGGGITVRSEVAEEYAESRWKADRLLAALSR